MRKLIFIAATTLVPTAASAGGYLIPSENARDIGLSQATVADQTGAEALIGNTAALAGQDGLDISISGELLVNYTSYSDPNLGDAKMNPQYNTPPEAAIAYGDHLPNGMGWAIGVGANVPAGGSIVWPKGWQGQEYIQSVSQKIYGIVGGAAFAPLPYIKIGATYQRIQGEEELHQEVNYVDHYGDAGLGMSGGANTFGLAGEFSSPDKRIPLTLGISYIRRQDATIHGDVHFQDVPAQFSTLLHDQKVSEALSVPTQLQVGASYAVIPNLRVMVGFSWEGWSIYHSDDFKGADGFEVKVPRDYKNAEVYRIGAEWVHVPFLPALTLRLGALRSISDQPTDTVSPSLTDGDSTEVSVGAGYNINRCVRIDLGYQHAFFDSVTASGPEALPGTYKTNVDIVSVGVNWRIGAKHSDAPPPPPPAY